MTTTTTIQAVYEDEVLKPRTALALPEKARVLVTIQSQSAPESDADRGAWLQASEEALTKTWENADDDVFNELLKT